MRRWLRDFIIRAFRLGPAVVDRSEQQQGHSQEAFAPELYGKYIATSAAVYTCASIRAKNLAQLPVRLYKVNARGDRTEVTKGALFDLLSSVNPFWTFGRLIRMTELSLCLWGQAPWALERGKGGKQQPTEIWWMRPGADHFTPIPHPTDYLSGFLYGASGEQIAFRPDEVIWLRYENPLDEYSGLSPIAASRLSIETTAGAMLANKRMFDQGLQLAGLLSPANDADTWQDDQVNALSEMLTRRFAGADKAHKLAVLGQAVKLQTVGIAPKDAQFMELLKWTLEDVCRCFGVPLDLVGGQRCVDDETEALTMRGWVRGDDLTTDDTILAMDPASGRMVWSRVLEVFRKPYSGPMYRMKHAGVDFLVTPGHRWVLDSGEFIRVEDIGSHDRIRSIGDPEASVTDPVYDDAFVELVGWAVTEGHYEHDGVNRRGKAGYARHSAYVRIVQNEGEGLERIRAALRATGALFSEYQRKGRAAWTLSVRGEVAERLVGVAPERVMSMAFLAALTPAQRELLIETMLMAEWNGHADVTPVFGQKDRRAAEAFAMLCTLAGRTTHTYEYRWGSDRPRWLTIMRKRGVFKIKHPLVPEQFSGMVWCPRTEYGTFVARRGGQVYVTGNTYENVDAAQEALWRHTLVPEAEFIAQELTEQLLPLFPGEADVLEFDFSQVAVLQEDRGEIVQQMKTLWDMGVPLNPLLQEFQPNLLPPGEQGYEWGDVWWAPGTLLPAGSTPPAPPAPAAEAQADAELPPADQAQRALAIVRELLRDREMAVEAKAVAYGSSEHERIWRAFAARADRHEAKLKPVLRDLFTRQEEAVLARLRAGKSLAEIAVVRDDEVARNPFDRARWGKEFKSAVQPVVVGIVRDGGAAALDDLDLGIGFDVSNPLVVRFVERSLQTFSKEVIATTYDNLRITLTEGILAGESIPQLQERIHHVFSIATTSRTEAIARTVTTGAVNGGSLLAAQQSGVVEKKTWLATLDDRVRPSHEAAHNQTVKLHDDFKVGGGSGPAPGQIGDPDEDIWCRCTLTYVLSAKAARPPVAAGANGHA